MARAVEAKRVQARRVNARWAEVRRVEAKRVGTRRVDATGGLMPELVTGGLGPSGLMPDGLRTGLGPASGRSCVSIGLVSVQMFLNPRAAVGKCCGSRGVQTSRAR